MAYESYVEPSDWKSDICYRGVSRNKVALCYVVRFSVWGKQLFIGNANSQKEAARLYDLALWKFLPKLPAMKGANFPDEFAFITQRLIDEKAPRLNDYYSECPFQSPEDATMTEDALREMMLTTGRRTPTLPSRNLASYNRTITRLKRLRLTLDAEFVKHDLARQQLPFLVKLPDTDQKFASVITAVRLLVDSISQLEDSMERHRGYYQKVACSDEQLERAGRAAEGNRPLIGVVELNPVVPKVFDGGASARPISY